MADSGQKTEQPTPKKLRDARKKGQVAKSQDLSNAFLFLTAAVVLGFIAPGLVEDFKSLLLSFLDEKTFSGNEAPGALMARAGEAWWQILTLSLPLLVGVAVMAALISFLQVQALFSPEAIKPSLEKLNPLQGAKNIFAKPKTYIELVKHIIKLAAVLGIVYANARALLPTLLSTLRAQPEQALPIVGELLSDLFLQIGAFFLALGAADFILQKKLHIKELMMTKEEVKREFKSDEGDPLIKGQRRELHNQIINESSIGEVRSADVIVVNPTHIAVALRYVEEMMDAPQVSTKGREERAKEIIRLARKYNVPVLRNVPLARSLVQVEIGREIPEDMYAAVAEVLNWVYQLRNSPAAAETR